MPGWGANVTICQLLTRMKRASGYPWTILAVPVGVLDREYSKKVAGNQYRLPSFQTRPEGGGDSDKI